jgi:hypothetical protein
MTLLTKHLTSPRTHLLPKQATSTSTPEPSRETKIQQILHKPAASQQKRNSVQIAKTRPKSGTAGSTGASAAVEDFNAIADAFKVAAGAQWLNTYRPLEPLTLNSRTPTVLYDIHFGFPFRVMQTEHVRLEPLVVSHQPVPLDVHCTRRNLDYKQP